MVWMVLPWLEDCIGWLYCEWRSVLDGPLVVGRLDYTADVWLRDWMGWLHCDCLLNGCSVSGKLDCLTLSTGGLDCCSGYVIVRLCCDWRFGGKGCSVIVGRDGSGVLEGLIAVAVLLLGLEGDSCHKKGVSHPKNCDSYPEKNDSHHMKSDSCPHCPDKVTAVP